ncbi:DUF3592 domain-containing protein [Culicoidibacter larvae]|uniref:DUF3592 domain-containing protein n=1 Tax=Culicoidibacter larvae TaxID=2579976 RepID=A0A5R8QF03_9FIRM|nr:DUF3592 domain-containing protein [Culicoidibacter larvae]TLG76552.1 hypothetical protein FEZ08_02745 [Culicoidibacter larvae]
MDMAVLLLVAVVVIAVAVMVILNIQGKRRMNEIATGGQICQALVHDRHSYLPDESNNTIQLFIDLEYELDGKTVRYQYTSNWIDILEMQDFAFAHMPGSMVEIRYIPDTPHHIVIQSETRPISFYLIEKKK